MSHAAPVSLLLIVPDSASRRALRRDLDCDGRAVVGVSSIGEALARLRSRRYDLVVCVHRNGNAMSEDYALFIDPTGLLSRGSSGELLYLAGIGIGSLAVLLVPTTDRDLVRRIVYDALNRLGRAGVAATTAHNA